MRLNVFWDNSNIWLVGKKVCANREAGKESAFRIEFSNLFEYVLDGRPVEYAFLAGSIPPASDEVWTKFNALGITVHTQERGAISGGEVAVDEQIHLAMLERLVDEPLPQAIVLLTGDGSGYKQGKGFIRQLERAVKKGWRIEVVSWDIGCNGSLKQYAKDHGRYRPLEPAYEKVSYIQGGRRAVKI